MASIGSGSYGDVRVSGLDPRIAVKFFREKEQWASEVSMLHYLHAAGGAHLTPTIHDINAKTMCIGMERMDCTLTEANFNGDARKKLGMSLDIIRSVLTWLCLGVAHRDIKPQNILVNKTGRLVVCDWGMAVPLPRKTKDPVSSPGCYTRQNRTHNNLVTMWYRAPEVFLDQRNYDMEKIDIWSLGCVLLQLWACPNDRSMNIRQNPLAGRNNLHQLILIGSLFGSPDIDELCSGTICCYYEQLRAMPSYPKTTHKFSALVQPQIRDLPEWQAVALKSFILSCLTVDPAARPSALDLWKNDLLSDGSGAGGGVSLVLPRSPSWPIPKTRPQDCIFPFHTTLSATYITVVFRWLTCLAVTAFPMSPFTLLHTLSFVMTFLRRTHDPLHRSKLQLLAVACLFMAINLFEEQIINCDYKKLLTLCDGAYTDNQIDCMVMQVCLRIPDLHAVATSSSSLHIKLRKTLPTWLGWAKTTTYALLIAGIRGPPYIGDVLINPNVPREYYKYKGDQSDFIEDCKRLLKREFLDPDDQIEIVGILYGQDI